MKVHEYFFYILKLADTALLGDPLWPRNLLFCDTVNFQVSTDDLLIISDTSIGKIWHQKKWLMLRWTHGVILCPALTSHTCHSDMSQKVNILYEAILSWSTLYTGNMRYQYTHKSLWIHVIPVHSLPHYRTLNWLTP